MVAITMLRSRRPNPPAFRIDDPARVEREVYDELYGSRDYRNLEPVREERGRTVRPSLQTRPAEGR
jgi:hypothetical protein